jgi:hypothetical protein
LRILGIGILLWLERHSRIKGTKLGLDNGQVSIELDAMEFQRHLNSGTTGMRIGYTQPKPVTASLLGT